jgi:hypothetical protein
MTFGILREISEEKKMSHNDEFLNFKEVKQIKIAKKQI